MSYASRDWKAVESTDLVGSSVALTVTGQVRTHLSSETVELTQASPQGISPVTLVLAVSVTGCGDYDAQMSWRDVSFERTVTSRQFYDVTVGGDVVGETIPVERLLS